jgi:hypothetical protein
VRRKKSAWRVCIIGFATNGFEMAHCFSALSFHSLAIFLEIGALDGSSMCIVGRRIDVMIALDCAVCDRCGVWSTSVSLLADNDHSMSSNSCSVPHKSTIGWDSLEKS